MDDRQKDIALAQALGYRVDYVDNIKTPTRYCLHRVEQHELHTEDTTIGWGLTEKHAWMLCPWFGVDWRAAGAVMDALLSQGWEYEVMGVPGREYRACFHKSCPFEFYAWAPTPQQAIRDAALKALGVAYE